MSNIQCPDAFVRGEEERRRGGCRDVHFSIGVINVKCTYSILREVEGRGGEGR